MRSREESAARTTLIEAQMLPCRTYVSALACWIGLALASGPLAAQQMADTAFRPVVERPAYAGQGPRVVIDEAHDNFHTRDGRYRPFAELLVTDGYRVESSSARFSPSALSGVDVVVVANARNLDSLRAGILSASAFTEEECDVLRDWVHAGGALLLIADHAPFGSAASRLGLRFGVTMGQGWVLDRIGDDGITTILDFSRANGRLGTHAILEGRDPSEAVETIRVFTGQSVMGPPEAAVLMRLSETAREAATPGDLEAEAVALRERPSEFGARSEPAGGRAQGIALRFGRGRLVVLGEAAMLSAQVVRFADGREVRAGMNVEGNDNQQFLLNVMHWLSGLLD